ncbi:LiaF transmembrane domain-containing protein [Gorillibacterium massiliense]|uniref:LiaF transmembrane domain-containing protein n=1 Tax=Gorillibacterium massiliense TaxID=1280390 RepID=UPI0004ADE188|nr:hypothetical protein [Gorillibacterium massiliense]
MKLQGKNMLALILIACGALILLGKTGMVFGWLIGLIVPIALIAFGYLGIRNGKKFIGTVLIVIGAVLLLGKLSGLIGIAIAVALILYGASMLRKKNVY